MQVVPTNNNMTSFVGYMKSLHVARGRPKLRSLLGKRSEYDWGCGLTLTWRNHFSFLVGFGSHQASGGAEPSFIKYFKLYSLSKGSKAM